MSAKQDDALAQTELAELKSSLADSESQLIKVNKTCTEFQDNLSKLKADNTVMAAEMRGVEITSKGLDARVVKLQSNASDAQASLILERKSHTTER